MIPVMPLPAMANPVAKAPVRAAQVGWAALYARTHGQASPKLIQSWLGVGHDQAQALMSDLIQRKIIHAPIGGAARAVEPMFTRSGIPGARPIQQKIATKAKEMVRELLDQEHAETHDIDPPELEEDETHETP